MRRVLPAAIALAAVAVLVGLGVWQLERRAWKQALINDVERGLATAPVLLKAAPGPDMAWRPATARGAWVQDGRVAVRPTTFEGKVGADIAAPFRLENGDVLIALIGWAPDGAATPELPATTDTVEIEGVLTPSPRPSAFTPDNAPPDQWAWLDPSAVAAAAGLDLARTSTLVLRVAEPPDGLKPRAARPNFPDNHLQYAMTWFGLAAALAVVAALAFRRRRRQP